MENKQTLQALPIQPSKVPILSLSKDDLTHWLTQCQQPAHRFGQIYQWIFDKRATDFSMMSDLPLFLREELAKKFKIFSIEEAVQKIAQDDTRKLLLKLSDGQNIECVLMKEDARRTVCISTQVGCAMGCVFCASGIDGVIRNLEAHEIMEQMILARNLLPLGDRLTHIVVMGMGEPMTNLENLLAALEVACSPKGLGLSARHITISTVGIPQKIRKLAECKKQYHLAVSLHAPNDELRTQIIPTNKKIGIQEILAASDDFFELTGRQVTFEYILLGGVNDLPAHAKELSALLANRKAHVNLIPFNTVTDLPFKRPQQASVEEFARVLKKGGQSATIRKRKGADIDAACGQLRRTVLAS